MIFLGAIEMYIPVFNPHKQHIIIRLNLFTWVFQLACNKENVGLTHVTSLNNVLWCEKKLDLRVFSILTHFESLAKN